MKRWTPAERQYVTDNHDQMTDEAMADNLPDRTAKAVKGFKSRMGYVERREFRSKRSAPLPDRSQSVFAVATRDPWEGYSAPTIRPKPR